MAQKATHQAQADHNRAVARYLLVEPRHDWAITAAFYAAIHYAECWVWERPEHHTETSIPLDATGRISVTPHAWREKLIASHLTRGAFKAFRKLREASETARYLSLSRLGGSAAPSWIGSPASQYIPIEQARRLVEGELDSLRTELSQTASVERLQLETVDAVVGALVRAKILREFGGVEQMLRQPRDRIQRAFSHGELNLLAQALAAHNLTLPTN